MVTKKVLISGLAIASLALTGCSDIQTAINNKIASTAKEVSGNINSEVAKTTDALKAQGEKMQSDFGAAADQLKKEFKTEVNMKDLKDTIVYKYINDGVYTKTSYSKFNDKSLAENGLTQVKMMYIDMCPENADGICGYTIFIASPSANWAKKTGKQTFYISTSGGGPLNYYGPFNDDLINMSTELNGIETVKVSTTLEK